MRLAAASRARARHYWGTLNWQNAAIQRRRSAVLRNTNSLRDGAVDALRAAQPHTNSALLLCLVEEIHGRPSYQEYVDANNVLIKPLADSFAVVARDFVEDLPRFATICAPAHAAPVARIPFVVSSGDAILRWLLHPDYLDANLARRHAASRHTNAYVVTSARADGLLGGVDALREELRSAPLTLAVLEAYSDAGAAPVRAALTSAGATRLLVAAATTPVDASASGVGGIEHVEGAASTAEELSSCKIGGCCGKDTPLLARDALLARLPALPAWTLSADEKSIRKEFVARNWESALKFFNEVSAIAEDEGHHPDLHLTNWRDVRVDLSTHAIGGLSLPDLVLAAKIDALDVEYSPKWLREQAAREAASDAAAADDDDSVALTVFEGEAAEALEVWRLPGWEAVRALERADLPGRVGGAARLVAFETAKL